RADAVQRDGSGQGAGRFAGGRDRPAGGGDRRWTRRRSAGAGLPRGVAGFGKIELHHGHDDPGRWRPRALGALVPGQLTSPYFVLGRRQPSTYDQLSPRLVALPLGSNRHVRLGLPPPSGLVWLAIWPGTLRGHSRRWQYSLKTL